ncbi:MAG: hypothetical protein SGPRY_002181 [Prymnesium sp.]
MQRLECLLGRAATISELEFGLSRMERMRACELLGAGGPAAKSRVMHKEAWLWLFKDYPHKRLSSYIYHGVRLGDTLELDIVIAPNLFSLYEVSGGAHAVADEMHSLAIGAGLWARGERSLVRTEGRPGRGIAEDGFPRGPEFTLDLNTPVDSINNLSGARVRLGGPRRDIYTRREMLPVAVLVMLFDYRYFFYHLVYELAEVWKRGFCVPARAERGGAHPEVLDVSGFDI